MENQLTSLSNSIVDLFESVYQSVVAIRSETDRVGSGFTWTADGYILTRGDTVKKFKDTEVILSDGRVFPSRVIGYDMFSNVGLLRIDTNNLKTINVDDKEKVKPGQLVFALASQSTKLKGIADITQGIISSPRASLRPKVRGKRLLGNFIITDSFLNPRYLGGPLIDSEGNFIGLIVDLRGGRGIVVGVKKIKNIISQLERHKKISYGYLGIGMREISLPKDLAQQDGGLIVVAVKKNTPAKNAGILIGDVILKLNDEQVDTPAALNELLTYDTIGKSIKLTILRAEKLQDLEIVPEEMTDQ